MPNLAASQITRQPDPQEIEQEVQVEVSKSEIMPNPQPLGKVPVPFGKGEE